MKLEHEIRDDVLHLRLLGDDALDYHSAPAIRDRAVELIASSGDVVCDLGAVEFIDSAGLGCLVGMYKAAHAGGRRVLFAGIRPAVYEVMRIIRLDTILELSRDVDAAERTLREAG